jgi:hypothetical protein
VTPLGVISDTHGVTPPEALAALAGSGRILHAGDAGSAVALNAPARIAPVVCVRGNTDDGLWAESLPDTALVEVERARVYVYHWGITPSRSLATAVGSVGLHCQLVHQRECGGWQC